ncbi:hypothetical protein MTR_6g082290 [Medicago truncatula]|uniref:Uncharacterized protein n=1 Tax=Medicago truncatula TaxID=3880 RepID=G7KMJ4_MEDTR|nr:hypothetical protein MTR_6g082290 [Medicago truncatula]
MKVALISKNKLKFVDGTLHLSDPLHEPWIHGFVATIWYFPESNDLFRKSSLSQSWGAIVSWWSRMFADAVHKHAYLYNH